MSAMAKWKDRTSIFYDAGAWSVTNQRRSRIIANGLGLTRVRMRSVEVEYLRQQL